MHASKKMDTKEKLSTNETTPDFLIGYKDRLLAFCGEVAELLGLKDGRGIPRVKRVLGVLSDEDCLGCIYRRLVLSKNNSNNDRADGIYRENHRYVLETVCRRLTRFLREKGYTVNVSVEEEMAYSTPDLIITIIPNGRNIEVRINGELTFLIEVKTGDSLNYPQLVRQLIDKPNAILVLLRIKDETCKARILHPWEIKDFIESEIENLVFKAEELLGRLKSGQMPTCNHKPNNKQKTLPPKNLEENLKELAKNTEEAIRQLEEKILEEIEKLTPKNIVAKEAS